MSKTHPLLLAVALLLVFHGQKASAEASGPDYFQITADQAVILYEKSDLNAKVLGLIPANTTGLKIWDVRVLLHMRNGAKCVRKNKQPQKKRSGAKFHTKTK